MLPTPPRKGAPHAEKKRKHSPEVKAEIALEAVKRLMTTSKIATSDEVHPTQVSLWKKEFLEHACDVFDGKHCQSAEIDLEQMQQRHHAKIGQLTLDVDWLKKVQAATNPAHRQALIDHGQPLSIPRQTALLVVNRSSCYYGEPMTESDENLAVMAFMDGEYTAHTTTRAGHASSLAGTYVDSAEKWPFSPGIRVQGSGFRVSLQTISQ